MYSLRVFQIKTELLVKLYFEELRLWRDEFKIAS